MAQSHSRALFLVIWQSNRVDIEFIHFLNVLAGFDKNQNVRIWIIRNIILWGKGYVCGTVDRSRQYESIILAYVLAKQVHASGRVGDISRRLSKRLPVDL